MYKNLAAALGAAGCISPAFSYVLASGLLPVTAGETPRSAGAVAVNFLPQKTSGACNHQARRTP